MAQVAKQREKVTWAMVFIGAVLLIKIVLMGLFSSDYQSLMFMRFVDGFLDELFAGTPVNPYQFFAAESNLFPYPPGMLIVECLGGLLSYAAGGSLFLKNLFFKLPILLFDCLGFSFLVKMLPGKNKYTSVLYFASPIVIYACFMHGQLDIIPTVLLLGALYYLTGRHKQRGLGYILFLSAAILCKFHILAVVPILFFYTLKRDGWKTAMVWNGMAAVITSAVIAPFFCQAFISNVVFNHEQSILTRIVIDYQTVMIYLPILAVSLVYLLVFTTWKINRELLFSYCGLLFSIFLCLIPPMPGWYVWVIPFIAIFFANMKTNRHLDLAVYVLLNAAYLLYFVFAHRTAYVDLYFLETPLTWLKQDNEVLRNGLFTVLIAALVCTIYMMYRSGVASNSVYRRQNLPFTIGVAGDSGSGKSTFLNVIRAAVGEKRMLTIEGDGDHRWERGNAMWEHFTHLNPKSNFLYRQAQDIAVLRRGQSVKRVDYDHNTGKFTKEVRILPKPYIVLCGLHSLNLPQIRSTLDLKIYMDIDETLRRYWKIQRDMASRGYDRETIQEQIERRIPDAEHYIYPQKKYADLIVTYYDPTLTDCWEQDHCESLCLKVAMDSEINPENLIQEVEALGIHVRYDYDEDLERQTIYFEGEALGEKAFPISQIAERLIPQVEEIAELPLEPTDGLHGILELLLLMLLSQKMQGG